MKYPVYPEMKDSGIEWLGEIPEHWEEIKLNYITKSIKNGTSNTQLDESPERYMVTRIETISSGNINYDKVGYIDYFDGLEKYKIEKYDILFSNINSLEMVGNCAIYNAEKPLYAGMNVLHIRANDKMIGKWLWYWFLSSKVNNTIKAWSKHAINQVSISVSTLVDLPVLSPPLAEQKAIASFLDKETGRIDQLIDKKEQLIKLLQEKRQALISHAVTKGLNPDVPMKDSGIEWLGEIPEHWEAMRLKYNFILNPSSSEIKNMTNETDVTFLPMEYIEVNGDINYENTKKYKDVKTGYTYFRNDDILLAKITPCFENGKSAIANNLKNDIGFGTTEVHILRVKKDKLNKRYLYYLVNSNPFMKFGESEMTGSAGQKRVPAEFINNYRQGFPPLKEQQQIAEYLDKETSKIDNLIEKVTQQISNLKEYRQALISNAVTGKIDVREVYQDE